MTSLLSKLKSLNSTKSSGTLLSKTNTTVITSQEPQPFQPLESIQTRMVTLQTLKMTSPQQLINLKATVKGVSGSKVIKVQKGGKTSNLTKSSATLVDSTGSTTAVFWEEWADCVQQDKTYIFTNLRAKKDNYSGEIYVNTAKEGFKIEETDNFAEDLAEIEPTITDMTTKETTISISIIGVKNISSYYVCSACGACGRNTEQSGKLLKCNSCNLRQRITPEAKHWFAKVFAQDTDTKSNFYLNIFHQQMVKLFEATDKNLHTGLSKEDLGDILAEIDDLKVTYNCVDGKLPHVN